MNEKYITPFSSFTGITQSLIDDVNSVISEEEKIKGGLADGKSDSNYSAEQLAKGIKVEMEHTDDEEKAKEIAKDHLEEDPKYYDHLSSMEKKYQNESVIKEDDDEDEDDEPGKQEKEDDDDEDDKEEMKEEKENEDDDDDDEDDKEEMEESLMACIANILLEKDKEMEAAEKAEQDKEDDDDDKEEKNVKDE